MSTENTDSLHISIHRNGVGSYTLNLGIGGATPTAENTPDFIEAKIRGRLYHWFRAISEREQEEHADRERLRTAARAAFRYTHGDVDFEFLPYDGWQEDVRTAAAFLLRERPDRTLTADRLLAAFSPPAKAAS